MCKSECFAFNQGIEKQFLLSLVAQSCLTLLWCLWTIAMDCSIAIGGSYSQVPLSMGFPRQEYWGGLPFPSPGDLPNPRSNSHFLHYRLVLYHWATWEARSPSIQQYMYEVAIVWIPPGGRGEREEPLGRPLLPAESRPPKSVCLVLISRSQACDLIW